MREFHVVGRNAAAVGSQQVVTGQALYCADLDFPGLLVGRLLYSAHPCARIRKLSVRRARTLPGVVAVLTHEDVPGENSYLYSTMADQPLLVRDFVRYQGDILAAVAAENDDAALAAMEAIEVEYEPLPGVFDVLEAMKPGARRVWPDRDNVHSHLVIERGDITEGFKNAAVILARTYSTHLVEHAFLETEGAVAKMEGDGVIVVYSSCQAPHRDRKQIARALALPENMVRVITPHVGGAFGGKDEAHVQIHAALLAQATGSPVRVQRTREESILTHVKRHPIIIRYRTGSTRDGKTTAIHVEAIGDTGPYLNAGEEVMAALASTCYGPYFVPNARIEALTVLTNNPICGAFRGFGLPQGTFAYERQMDEVARELGMDPYEIRMINAVETGQPLPTGAILREGRGMKACLKEAARLSNWWQRNQAEHCPEPHLRRGWGMACTLHTVGIGRNLEDHAGASLDMTPDGSVLLRTGAADMGQGVHTILAQLAAETLGVELSNVRVVGPDTAVTSDAGASVATRQTFVSGNAVMRAAEPVRDALLEIASQRTGLDKSLLDLRGGKVLAEGEELSLTVSELASRAHAANVSLHADGYYAMEFPEKYPENVYPYAKGPYAFGTQVARVVVDIETGEVKVEEIVAVHDVGRVINPGGVAAQIEGGVTMGFGWTVMEELLVDRGRTLNLSLGSYLVPTSMDSPVITSASVEIPEPYGPLGARGLGEATVNPTPAAIANAVRDAIGVPMDHLPLTPERVLEALQE